MRYSPSPNDSEGDAMEEQESEQKVYNGQMEINYLSAKLGLKDKTLLPNCFT